MPGSAVPHVLQLLHSSRSVGAPDRTICYLSVGLVDFISVALTLLAGLDCLFMSKKKKTHLGSVSKSQLCENSGVCLTLKWARVLVGRFRRWEASQSRDRVNVILFQKVK